VLEHAAEGGGGLEVAEAGGAAEGVVELRVDGAALHVEFPESGLFDGELFAAGGEFEGCAGDAVSAEFVAAGVAAEVDLAQEVGLIGEEVEMPGDAGAIGAGELAR
jgi:hypothetical protein